jgi:hypothetical protein
MKKGNLGATVKVILDEEEEDRIQQSHKHLALLLKPQPVLSECHQQSAVKKLSI